MSFVACPCLFDAVTGLQHHLLRLPALDCQLYHCTMKPASVQMQHPNAASCAEQVCIAVHILTGIGCICRARQTRQSKRALQVNPCDYLSLTKTEGIQFQPAGQTAVGKIAHMRQGADLDQPSHVGCSDDLTLN